MPIAMKLINTGCRILDVPRRRFFLSQSAVAFDSPCQNAVNHVLLLILPSLSLSPIFLRFKLSFIPALAAYFAVFPTIYDSHNISLVFSGYSARPRACTDDFED